MNKKKLLVCLLILCLAFAMTGCTMDAQTYEPDPDSVCGAAIGAILIFFQGITSTIGLPNFCVGIFILTLLVKLVTHPLTVKQQKNVKAMSVLQPKLKDINKRYENSPEKKQEAMMKLYKEESINPMASCLPLLIQMPIIMVLFWGMRNFIPPTDLVQYYSFFWIEDLSAIVSTTAYSHVLPLLCACTTVLQQAVSMPNLQDKTQKMMLFIMPVMFYFISINFPAGLCLYWIFYGLITAIQTLYVNFRLKIGFFATPEEKQNKKNSMAAEKQNKNQDATDKQKEEKQQRQQSHTHTHNATGTNPQQGERKMPDKPWQ